LVGPLAKGGRDLALRTAAEDADRALSHQIAARPNAQTAQNALSLRLTFESRGSDPELPGEICKLDRFRGLGQQQLQNETTRLLDLCRLGMDDSSIFERMAARGNEPGAARSIALYQTDTTRSIGCQAT
jgi:hypothetical protein